MQPVTERLWVQRDCDLNLAAQIQQQLQVGQHVARILVSRGITSAELAQEYLTPRLQSIPDPALMAGVTAGSIRIAAAICAGEQITVFGDYDVDGVTSTTLLTHALAAMGASVNFHIPNRMNDGYGISAEAVRGIAQRGAKVMISVDCGITSVKEAALARELGLDLIITDHHLPGETLPDAVAVIDPSREDCGYPYKKLAGVGVAFMLLIDVRRRLKEQGHFSGRAEVVLREYLDLVALGTIADVAPITGVNRAMVAHGLQVLSIGHRTGVAALKKVAELEQRVSCGDVGFKLGPRINAAGRLDDATVGVQLLLTTDAEGAAMRAQSLNDANLARQEVEQAILAEAVALIIATIPPERKTIVLAHEGWHPGVIGIVASRIVEQFHRPTWLITMVDGVGKASGRSIAGFDLHGATNACRGHLLKFGGHHAAAGLSIEPQHIAAFAAQFEQEAAALLDAAALIPRIPFDVELTPQDLTIALADSFSRLEPFGVGNPEPTVVIRGAQVLELKVLKEKHLKLKLQHGQATFDAIAFNMAAQFCDAPARVDLLGNLQINVWNERRSLQLRVKDLKRA